ncbi:uncharacterized protein LOC115623795 [Scaptodrosophila lebanonensis]|uniref:Uncharacterized protein LOC115623795 n=1 Tax=Drosophila lebanonensis TaxID=7225 RepID=A0A6J2TFI5_DROLE|nr:uncharacterized protein LOC115623795 [Scaptodrosophila lebanonensis]
MNISSTVSWVNTWESKTLCNVGPDVLCLRQGNVVKFINLQTNATSYFKAETVATGVYISAFAGHYRFPLFAFAESVLHPQIHVYKYPDFTKFNTLSPSLLNYHDISFSEYDLLVAIGGHPNYPICVFNYRTGMVLVKQETYIMVLRRSFVLSNNNFPTIVQFNREHLSLACYEMCFLEKMSFLHKISEVELGNNYIKSAQHFMTFGDDNGLYVVNDFGVFSQIDIACFLIKQRWAPASAEFEELDQHPRAHGLTAHKMGFLLYNSSTAYYLKRRTGQFAIEWKIDELISNINMFVSNSNGELYAERELGSIYHVHVTETEGRLEQVVKTGVPIKLFRQMHGLKEECIVLLHDDGVSILDLMRNIIASDIHIPRTSYMYAHHVMPYVVVSTFDARLILLQYERASQGSIVFDLQCDTPAILSLAYFDSCVVFKDELKIFHIVSVEYRPAKMSHLYSFQDDQIVKHVFVHSYRLLEGNRLMVFIARDKHIKKPGHAEELWLYQWTRDNRLRRREYILPHTYAFTYLPLPTGRWVQIEFFGAIAESTAFDHLILTDHNELHLLATIKTPHFGYITGLGMTKNLLSWGVDGIIIHFRTHKRSRKPFMISRFLKVLFAPINVLRAREIYNSKYLVVHLPGRHLRVMRLPSLADNVRENKELPLPQEGVNIIEQANEVILTVIPLATKTMVKEVEFTQADFMKRERVFTMIAEFAAKVTALIDYDMEVTGKSQGIFKKFCFNYEWLDAITDEAHKLCGLERESLELAIKDQSRIRDWIMRLVTAMASSINYKVRSIFADANFESFALLRKPNMELLDKYRFYDLEDHMRMSIMSDMELEEIGPPQHGPPPTDFDDEGEEEEDEQKKGFKEMKPFVVEGDSVYEHIMAPIFRLQDKNLVTSNQIYNVACKYRHYLNLPLKQEFNKLFHEAQQMKQETIDSVLNTNSVLYKIYDNMNIMLRLLQMDMFDPPALSVPQLAKDEAIKCIMEVDDSEIKAVNRRRKKTIDLGGKRGRLLLWSIEFWARALIIMMDGVIEKLWEEEIKKDIPLPEFMVKKQPHEYNLEDQKMFRAYEEAVRQLGEDRRKYLKILHENEAKTLELKTQQILKLNKRERLRSLNLKRINFQRVELRKRINLFYNDVEKLNQYITKYNQLLEFWERGLADTRIRMDTQQTRDRAVERQFRNNFLNTVPHATHEMTKLFKKRPKLPAKLFPSALICMETAHKLSGKHQQRMTFPLPAEVLEFLALIDDIDQPKNCPQQVDTKNWEAFIKLRRQKVESELKLKGLGYQMVDCQGYLNNITKDIAGLKDAKLLTQKHLEDATQQYLEVMRNRTLQLTLSLGQVEVSVMRSPKALANSVLMHVDDINGVNRMIKEAGDKKIKAMQRVAVFRRQVIFKEWEHKLYKANIAYLKYMLDAIEHCKVTIEFLNILRNWNKVKAERQKFMAAGAIERVIEQKISAFKKHIERVNAKIDICKANTLDMKRDSHAIDSKIERFQVEVCFKGSLRDTMMEERRDRERDERMAQIIRHRQALDKVRRHYVQVLELQTILELLRLRTYPTLGPPLPQCHPPVPEHILSSVPNNP